MGAKKRGPFWCSRLLHEYFRNLGKQSFVRKLNRIKLVFIVSSTVFFQQSLYNFGQQIKGYLSSAIFCACSRKPSTPQRSSSLILIMRLKKTCFSYTHTHSVAESIFFSPRLCMMCCGSADTIPQEDCMRVRDWITELFRSLCIPGKKEIIIL